MERLLTSLNGVRIYFLFVEEYISTAATATGTGILLCFLHFFLFFFRAKQEDTYTAAERVAKEEIAGLSLIETYLQPCCWRNQGLVHNPFCWSRAKQSRASDEDM